MKYLMGMDEHQLSVREMQADDISLITDYWLESDPDFLVGMGADLSKMPSRKELNRMLTNQLRMPLKLKMSYALIWLIDNKPSGHTNVNSIIFGKEAYMHLHIWHPDYRKKGIGTQLVTMSLPYYFENLKLQELFCEPYALNPAPNRTLAKVGFEFVREYVTIPGMINFEQPVKQWKMTKAKYLSLGEGS